MILSCPDESSVKMLMGRSLLIRSCCELWAHSKSTNDFHDQLRRINKEITQSYLKPEKSFKIVVDTFNQRISLQEKIERVEVAIRYTL